MKFYVASKWEDKTRTKKVLEQLKDHGHEIEADWTVHERLDPFEENLEKAQQNIEKDLLAARNCDVFVLLSNQISRGSHAELGAALAENIAGEGPKIYIVGEYRDDHLFYFHDSVTRVETVDEVFEDLE
jgi:hypothetical protein